MNYLYAAYAAAFVIHGTYIAILMRRHARLKRERDAFEKESTLRGPLRRA